MRRFLLFSLLLLLVGCLPAETPTPAATLTTTPSPSATPTTVWFPPTSTPTTPPTRQVTPTRNPRPGMGELLYENALDDAQAWQLPQSTLGSVSLNDARMTFALHSPHFNLASLRSEPWLSDFYAETHIRLSLCRGDDAYGILFRVNSSGDYYRATLNCQREVRLGRVRNGKLVYLQPPLPSPDVPPGAPAETTLGVWASGREIRIFVNGNLQFSVTDPVFRSGGIGLFAKSGENSSLTLVFSDLQIYQVSYISPTPSPTLTPTRIPTSTARP